MMKCGHSANAKGPSGEPCCALCIGIDAGACEVAIPPKLIGRIAKCPYISCGSAVPSSVKLPFFEHKPNDEFDSYYCGCYGWN